MIVLKFGGSCLDGPDDIRRMAGIVKSTEPLRPKVVLSAFKGVTDELIGQAELARKGSFDVSGIESRHLGLLEGLPADIRTQVEPETKELLEELKQQLTEVAGQKRLGQDSADSIAAYGEKLAISVASGYLAEAGLTGVPLAGAEAGIITDGVFGNASILDESYAMVWEKVSPVHVPLVAGFFGVDKLGRVTILGRGASDYVATFIAAALGCKAVLFKDVDGVMTADPKVVPGARLIPKLNYETAMELARYGSKVLFQKAVGPAMKARIPLEIRNFEKHGEGTVVAGEGEGEAVSYIRTVSLVKVTGMPSPREGSAILAKLEEVYGRDSMLLVSVSQNEVSILTDHSRVEGLPAIVGFIEPKAEVAVQEGVSVVALTGRRITVSQVSEAIQRAQMAPIGVFRTASDLTTCAVVQSSETDAAVRALHTLLER